MTRRYSAFLFALASVAAAGCSQAQTPAAAQSAAYGETRYLAFQVFTGSTSPQAALGSDAVLDAIPDRAQLDAFAADVISRIGTTGDARRRLALMFGPIAFDHSDARAEQLIEDAFDIALERQVAIGFHLDDSMFWGARRDLVADARNIERGGWDAPPSTSRRLDWGPVPALIAPQMCLNSPAIEAEVRRRGREVIGAAIARGLARLHAEGRDDLFAGVIVGWETHIGRDSANPQMPLGYCALGNRNLDAGAAPQTMDEERIEAVQGFITLWSRAVAAAGVPEARIYSHVGFVPRRTFDVQGARSVSYAQTTNFAPTDVAFGPARRAGFSTYPGPGVMEEIYAETRRRGGAPWASAEGANVDLGFDTARGDGPGGMSAETYLARHFNHGAVLVNIFGWGLGAPDNGFRRTAEHPDALAAYRKFLRGEALIEGAVEATIQERLPAKIRRIQAELPRWVSGHRDRQARAQPRADALTAALQANDLRRAEREADALLALLNRE
jgi:hypothetical protein